MGFVSIKEEALWKGLNDLLDIDDFKEKIAKLKGMTFSPEYVSVAADIFKEAISKVEEVATEGMGKEKRKVVIKWLDGVIRLPFYIEWLDDLIIGAIVDAVVGWIYPKKG